ncbi:MAG: glycosyltransferase family 2 protein [Acidobacteriota bacterium]
MDLSIIIPVFNEQESLPLLHERLSSALARLNRSNEILYVDDGSTDGSHHLLADIARRDPSVRVISLARNFGQTAALSAGFDHARGEIIVPLDADLQNDPDDIPAILAKLAEGYDVVSCWRVKRQDPYWSRRLPSQLANWLISVISGVSLHDYGCTLKGYRKSNLQHVRLYGEMHRFIPILASLAGARVAEIPVRHHPRRLGHSKYGIGRSVKVLLDLITIKFLAVFSTKPMYLFGGAGFFSFVVGSLLAVWTLYDKLAYDIKAYRNPLLLLAIFFVTVGVQFILFGLMAELIIRTYHESQNKPTYVVRAILSGDAASEPRVSVPRS